MWHPATDKGKEKRGIGSWVEVLVKPSKVRSGLLCVCWQSGRDLDKTVQTLFHQFLPYIYRKRLKSA